jgi:hypothetical protein
VIPQSGESIGGLLRSVGLQATLLASITADPASHIDVLFLQVDHAVSKPKTKREIQQRPELRIAGLPIFTREDRGEAAGLAHVSSLAANLGSE